MRDVSIKKIGILTSGGDAPGMNAAIRAVVRTSDKNHIGTVGFFYGYRGLVNGLYRHLDSKDASNILQKGGTILKSARNLGFYRLEERQKAYQTLKKLNINGLIVIGGDGTFRGGYHFGKENPDIAIIGIPATIDNDIFGTDYTIGYDSALNTVVQAIDRIRDTADAHDRVFFIEVMGHYSGFLALETSIACGAELTLLPEESTVLEKVEESIRNIMLKHDRSAIVVVAEGNESGGALPIVEYLKKKLPNVDIRVTILGHIQRGGSPTAQDRILASTLGFEAVNAIKDGYSMSMVGIMNHKTKLTPLKEVYNSKRRINSYLFDIARNLR